MTAISRRDFLKLGRNVLLGASAVLSAGGLLRYLSYGTESAPPQFIDLGSAEAYPLGSRTLLTDVPAFLIHDEQGFHALNLRCTHLGCTVEKESKDFYCPCHGSKYALDGVVLQGPATQPLSHFQVELDANGHLILSLNES